MLATASFGMILLTLSLIWSPGVNKFGTFQFTHLFKTFSNGEESVMRLTSVLTVIVAITGQFRIPPNSPACRRLMFEYSAYTSAASTLMLLSNIGGMTHYFFDAWSVFGRVAIVTPIIGALVSAFRMLDDSINGPMKGTFALKM